MNAKLGLLFNNPINPLTVTSDTVMVYDQNARATALVTLDLRDDNRLLEISPLSPWAAGTSFIQVRVNGVEDVNGSALPNRYYYFYGSGDTVEDHTSPQITRLTPP